MQVQLQSARPPYVRFEVRDVEDREATIANKGVYSTKDAHFALITPSGSKDVHEKLVDEWFTQMRQFVMEDRFPRAWLDYYENEYRAWREGVEVTLAGTDIRNWAIPSPSQKNMLRGMNIRTVEDLADATEEALSRMGLGGRELKAQAQAWVKNASTAQAAAETRVAELEKALKAMEEKMGKLAEQAKTPASTDKPAKL